MLKATYDTNILVSGTTVLQGPIANVINAWIDDEIELITSKPLIDELSETLQKPYFVSKLSDEQIQSYIDIIKNRATIVSITTPIPTVSQDPDDNLVLATAESGTASFIVTGDHQLLDLKQYKNIKIVNARAFSEILEEEKAA